MINPPQKAIRCSRNTRTHPEICLTNYEPLYFYYFLLVFPQHTSEVQGDGGQDPDGDGCEGHGGQVGGGSKGRILEAIKEGLEWCGTRSLWEEEVIGKVSG